MNVLPEALEELTSRMDALEKRVYTLEHSSETFAKPDVELFSSAAAPQLQEDSGIERASGVLPVLGTAMLGIAGAYVLRAVAESSLIPRRGIAVVAIVYAVAWLVWAARARATVHFVRAIYASTSVLILVPMLWELTLRFNILSPTMTACILGGFVVASTALAWERDLAQVFWIAQGTSGLTALALPIATHQLLPFTATLLLMALLCEYASARDRGQSIRPLVMALADIAVGVLIFIYSGPQSTRVDYPAVSSAALIAPACLLFLINTVFVAFKAAKMHRRLTVFETVQAMIAFLLAASSVMFFEPNIGQTVLGVSCLLLSAGCYAAVFLIFRSHAEPRNFSIFAAWAIVLFLAGALWSLPPAWSAACLGLAAFTSIVLALRLDCKSLAFHGVVYLAFAEIEAGLPQFAFRALVGPMPTRPALSVFVVSAFAALCYAASNERVGEDWQKQFLHFVPAFLATFGMAAIVAQGIAQLAAHFIPLDLFHLAFIRTLTICCLALALAFLGTLLRRIEMTRIAYAALVFEGAKLLFEDLRSGRVDLIAASFILFALTLIAIPRLARAGHKK